MNQDFPEEMEIKPLRELNAVVDAPPSKAHTLRAIFMAALARGRSRIKKPLLADDQMIATAIAKLVGANVEHLGDEMVIGGTAGSPKDPERPLYVGMSGVCMNFTVALASIIKGAKTIVDGAPRMREGRPIFALVDALSQLGVPIRYKLRQGYLPVEVSGRELKGGCVTISKPSGSQFFSAVLFVLPYATGDTIVESDSRIPSRPYIDITIECMRIFGVEARAVGENAFFVRAGQCYKAADYRVEGDYSNASYFLAAAAVTGGRVLVRGLRYDSTQGDRFIVDILRMMGCRADRRDDGVLLEGGPLAAVEVDMSDNPDIVPTVAVVASFARGTTVLRGVGGLRFKETDRLVAIVKELGKMGIEAAVEKNSLIIKGGEPKGALIDTYGDHRMAMSFAVAGLRVPGVRICSPGVVAKSFPDFFDRWGELYKEARGESR